MDLKKVTQLVDAFKDSELSAINFEDKTTNIRLKKTKAINTVTPPAQVEPIVETKEIAPVETRNIKKIVSEGVGFFFPSIEQSAIDANVKIVKGRELYYIKAMNLKNQKKLDYDCKVLRFLVEAGAAVEYGQPIVEVEVL
ncbi:MAG: hypothetical protein PHF25_06865 [Candidatus Margulisbacteria bacterium]|nr:hypothetical protein [Candidatus Margulisiibacteriota bacterium]